MDWKQFEFDPENDSAKAEGQKSYVIPIPEVPIICPFFN
jgi:hypothetical protein